MFWNWPDAVAPVDDGEAEGEEVGQHAEDVDDVHGGFDEPVIEVYVKVV